MQMLIIFSSVLIIFSGFTNAQNPCKTPNSKDGMCVPLRYCPSILSIIQNHRTSSQSQLLFAQQSSCVPTDNNNYYKLGRTVLQWVCCEPSFKESDFPIHCGTQLTDRIVNGKEASLSEFPWLALLRYRNNRNQLIFRCGGSLINKNYVLTAAHCTSTSEWELYSVRLGEYNLLVSPDCEDGNKNICAPSEQDVPIAEFIPHEWYFSNLSPPVHDIALIRLARSVEFSSHIKPICLPFAPNIRDNNFENVLLTVAGFGKTSNNYYATNSHIKMKVDIKGSNWNQCNDNVAYNRKLVSSHLCVGGHDDQKDSCTGDSGGPLMKVIELNEIPINYLVGIVSYGPAECGSVGTPALYTRVDEYLSWIRYNMKP